MGQSAEQSACEAMDAATARMERLANRVIERIIRNGFVGRADVKALRDGDRACRAASIAMTRAVFHPLGRCICHGEGQCAWCIASAEREARDGAEPPPGAFVQVGTEGHLHEAEVDGRPAFVTVDDDGKVRQV